MQKETGLVAEAGKEIAQNNCTAISTPPAQKTQHESQAPAPIADVAAVMTNFQKSASPLASSPAAENFKFRRQDWALFRTVEGLQQRAGVSKERLRRLILKELADNGLDNDAHVEVGEAGGGHYVEDDGSGIEPDEVARLFSIARDMESTKLWRLPTRGALGNGLRVVAGGVLASCGSLTVDPQPAD